MNGFGPQYCETPLDVAGVGFPVEFVNTLSNLPTILFGLLAFWFVYTHAPRRYELYFLAFFLTATGVGSTLWHGLRTSFALTLDVLPGLLFFFIFVYCWVRLLKDRVWAIAVIPVFFLIQFFSFQVLSSFSIDISPFIVLYGVVLLFGLVLLYFTYKKFGKRVTAYATTAMIFALFAATMRTVDLYVCEYTPFGTHLLWHFFLGFAGLVAIFTVYVMGGQHSEAAHPEAVLSEDG